MKCSFANHRPVERLTIKEMILRSLCNKRSPMPIYCADCGKKLKAFYVEVE